MKRTLPQNQQHWLTKVAHNHPRGFGLVGFVLLSSGITAFCLQRFASLIAHLLSVEYSALFEVCMVLGQVVFQWGVMFRDSWEERLHYLFVVLSISLMGSLLLVPLLTFSIFYDVTHGIALTWFFSVVLVMFLTHRHWLKLAGLPWYLTWTWVLYRVLLLIYITFPRGLTG